MNQTLENPAQQIWQTQPVEGTKMSAEAIRLRAGKFERRIMRRNLRELIASVIVTIAFGYFCIAAPNALWRTTWGLFIAGTVWVMFQLRRKGTPRTMPEDIGAATSVGFFRSELERQRDLVKNVWPWYLAPLVPGYIALNLAWVLAPLRPTPWTTILALDLFFAAIFLGVWKLNQRAARCLQRSIDELARAESEQR
ncbi:MAG TPA: hypothetical protein VGG04_09875 [Candidatus Sulfotelmatobacter sp.]|jgi:hypothetical protein